MLLLVRKTEFGKSTKYTAVTHDTISDLSGHNWGSFHDPNTAECNPSSTDGKYLMYEFAQDGIAPNNMVSHHSHSKSFDYIMIAIFELFNSSYHPCYQFKI